MEENIEEQVVDNQELTNEVQEEQPKTTQVLEDGTYRVDLSIASEEPTEAVQPEPEVEAVQEQPEEQDVPVVEEVIDEPETEVQVEQTIEEPQREEVIETSSQPQLSVPEGIQKLIDFMDETGGTIEDYARLNADYSGVDDKALLAEYYKSTKPHLTRDEIDFIIEDKFQYDEDMDDERDIRRKQLAYKEEIAHAKSHLEGMKSKYYQELKLGSKLTKDQQQAIEFFNRYNEEQKQVEELTTKQQQHFNEQTNKVFNQDFKGFDFKVGDRKFRYNVKDVAETKEAQSNVFNAFSKYVDNNNLLSDAKGYHKSLYAARNPDALANHFYEQGKADAIKEMTSQAKNINVDNRKTTDGFIQAGGAKVRVVSGENSSSTKLRLKNY